MSHGFGGNPGEYEDPRVDGANTNRLLRTDVEYDRYTGIPRMGALPVAVVPLASTDAHILEPAIRITPPTPNGATE
jgi:hypothetical protein